MCYSEIINYEALSVQCKSICLAIQKEMKKFDYMIEMASTKFASNNSNKKIEEYKKHLEDEKSNIENQIFNLMNQADEMGEKGQVTVSMPTIQLNYEKNNLINQAKELNDVVNNKILYKFEIINEFINQELHLSAQNADKRIQNIFIVIKDDINNDINLINDVSLRECVYREAIKKENENLTFEKLLSLGTKKLEELGENLVEKNRTKIIAQIQKDMENAAVQTSIINRTLKSSTNIKDIKDLASQEIIGEEIRKQTLKIIVKLIENMNFIVDRKKNIKIDREKNEVVVIGSRPNGQTIDIKIYLNGGFSYRFEGYEGQACKDDMEPFMENLKKIYGFKISNWKNYPINPDKICSKKYQNLNTEKLKK